MSFSQSSSSDSLPLQSPNGSARTLDTPISSAASNASIKSNDLADSVKFRRWRPSFHVQATSGWMNDPCAPLYDPHRKSYSVFFQWNPNGLDWGDIAWGRASSPDLIHWTVDDLPSLSPEATYDCKGIFTGCHLPSRDGTLACAYTSVNALPIHHTLPHARGSESLSLVRSADGGKTWTRSNDNPILPCEPTDVDVTGWRDPFVARWDAMSHALGRDPENTLFGIISGGIRDITPTTFLYAIDANDVRQWEYLGPLVGFGLNKRPSRWSGDLGKNWEVTNFVTLRDNEGAQREFLVMGTEGCLAESPFQSEDSAAGPARPPRGQLWMSGSLQRPQDSQGDRKSSPIEMTYDFGGHLDHGCLYAANSSFDTVSQKQLVWGWITEEDLCDELRHAQGWSGMLSMPRELQIQTLNHVSEAYTSKLSAITSIDAELDRNGTYTVRTLASQPFQPLVEALRRGPQARCIRLEGSELSCDTNDLILSDIDDTHWEMSAEVEVSDSARRIGFALEHAEVNDTLSRHMTTISFDPSREIVTVERPPLAGSASGRLINSSDELAPHTLFRQRDPETGEETLETLKIRAWRDNSVLEIFVNDRTAISTRIYGGDHTHRLRFFAEDAHVAGGDDRSTLISATLWNGIGL